MIMKGMPIFQRSITMMDLYQAVLLDRHAHRRGKASVVDEDAFYRSHARPYGLLRLLRRLRWWT